jgi:beta-galactosidase
MDYRIENQRLLVEGEPVSLFSASFQYWRSIPSAWQRCLRVIRDMGFHVIETYMPWSVHELARGKFDFGSREPARDIARFLDLCAAEGIQVLARPGPHINAELTYFGFPKRIFAYEEMLCRSSDGTVAYLPAPPRMFPLPCYHHPRFTEEVLLYFQALAGEIRERFYPDGPILAVQVDNECSKFFRTHPFDLDYSAPAVRLYRVFLEGKYGDIDRLNHTYRADYRSFSLVDPPRSLRCSKPERVPYYLDWAQFGEYYITESLRCVAALLRRTLGEGFPLYHNYPVTMPSSPLDMVGTEEFVDFQGIDCYPRKTDYYEYSKGIRFTAAASRLPFMAEFSCGGAYFGLPVTLDEQKFTTWSALANGLKGMNFYMIVERERWYGSPVRNDGSTREAHADFYRRLLSEIREWGLEDMTCVRPVMLLVNRDYQRLANVSALMSPVSGILSQVIASGRLASDAFIADGQMGFEDNIAADYTRLLSFWFRVLYSSGVHFGIADERSLTTNVRLAVAPTFEFMNSETQRILLLFAQSGGTLVCGPRTPGLDERMEECGILSEHMRSPVKTVTGGDVLGLPAGKVSLFEAKSADAGHSAWYSEPVGSGNLVHLGAMFDGVHDMAAASAFRPLVDTLLRLSGLDPFFLPEDPRPDICVWRGRDRMVAFVVNPTPEGIKTTVSGVPGCLEDLRNGERFDRGTFSIDLDPYSVRVLGGET